MANYPKQIVPPFGKDDIKDIVQDGITNGDIVLPPVEGGTKLYLHEIANNNSEYVFVITDKPTPAVYNNDGPGVGIKIKGHIIRAYDGRVAGTTYRVVIPVTVFAESYNFDCYSSSDAAGHGTTATLSTTGKCFGKSSDYTITDTVAEL